MKNNLIYKIYPYKTIKRIEAKIKMLGEDYSFNEVSFLEFKLILSILVFIFLLFWENGYFFAPIGAILVYILSEKLILDRAIKIRGKKLEKESLFFLEVLVLTLEGGRNLKQALTLTVNNVDAEISKEFKRTLVEIDLGKSLNEALNDMKKRIPSDVINNVILGMVESNTYGNSITDSIYNQIEYLRNKQILDVKAEIAKLPTKISVVSVIFFIPIMLLVILAPIIIRLIGS